MNRDGVWTWGHKCPAYQLGWNITGKYDHVREGAYKHLIRDHGFWMGPLINWKVWREMQKTVALP